MNPSNPDLAQAQGRPYSTRQSMSGRISRLFERRQGPSSHFSRSQRTSGACEVPIFMSQSSDHLHYHQDEEAVEVEPHHRESMEDDERHTVRGSSIYSQSPHFRAQNTMNEFEEDTHSRSSDVTHDLEAGHSTLSTTSEVDLLNQKRRKRRRIADSYRERIASKKKLGMAFGVTTLAAVITCKQSPTKLMLLLTMYRHCASSDRCGQRNHVSRACFGLHSDPHGRLPSQCHHAGHTAAKEKSSTCPTP